MEPKEAGRRAAGAARTILSFCMVRTSTQQDAEDLAQDILLAVIKSAPNLQNDQAFYGFMWSVAGNVYKEWCKKRRRQTLHLPLDEHTGSGGMTVEEAVEQAGEIVLLRRELSLLSERYRKAVVMYYLEKKSCAQIAARLNVSESMVKYLLFKSRKILREGMNMERTYGEQSYHPRSLSLLFWGNGNNRYFHLCDGKIAQNILLACYNDALTLQEVSLTIGVAVPYLEEDINRLLEHGVLLKKGNRYLTNIVIFTKEFSREVDVKTADLRQRLAASVEKAVLEKQPAIRNIGFYGADMSENTYRWQTASILLYQAVIQNLQESLRIEFPIDSFGAPCFIWGTEGFEGNLWESQFAFGISNAQNERGDYLQFMDFTLNGEMVHHYFYPSPNISNVYFDIAAGRTKGFSETDQSIVADMVRRGYVKAEDGLKVNVPVFTKGQFEELTGLLKEDAEKIAREAEAVLEAVTDILLEYTPPHLKQAAAKTAWLRSFDDGISAPMALLYANGILKPPAKSDLLPTTYLVLAK